MTIMSGKSGLAAGIVYAAEATVGSIGKTHRGRAPRRVKRGTIVVQGIKSIPAHVQIEINIQGTVARLILPDLGGGPVRGHGRGAEQGFRFALGEADDLQLGLRLRDWPRRRRSRGQ